MKDGIKIVNPNDEISEEYLRESLEDLDMVGKSNEKWKSVTSYYACYNALYAVLQKTGIKSEIHDCTLDLMFLLGFDEKDYEFIKTLKEERIDIQYKLRKPSKKISEDEVKRFIHKCRIISSQFTDPEIQKLRSKLNQLRKEAGK